MSFHVSACEEICYARHPSTYSLMTLPSTFHDFLVPRNLRPVPCYGVGCTMSSCVRTAADTFICFTSFTSKQHFHFTILVLQKYLIVSVWRQRQQQQQQQLSGRCNSRLQAAPAMVAAWCLAVIGCLIEPAAFLMSFSKTLQNMCGRTYYPLDQYIRHVLNLCGKQ